MNNLVKSYSPQGEVVDILSSRESFENVFEYAKNIYKLSCLSLSEKLTFAHYTSGGKNSKDFFSLIPTSTHYQSAWFKEIKKAEMENPGSEIAGEKWKRGFEENSRYATIGHNPYLEVREVFNLNREEKDGWINTFTWYEKIGGEVKKVIYQI